MSDFGDDWHDLTTNEKEARAKEFAAADTEGWTKHTLWHWQKVVNGKLLDYWPSKGKFMYAGKVRVGDVREFIAKITRN